MEPIKSFIKKLTSLFDKEQYGAALRLYERDAPSYFQSIISQNDRRKILLLAAKIYYFNQMYDALNSCLTELENQYVHIESYIDFITLKFHFLSITGKTTKALGFITRAISHDWTRDEYQWLNYFLG